VRQIQNASHAKDQREADRQHGVNGAGDCAVNQYLHYFFIQGGNMNLPVRNSLG